MSAINDLKKRLADKCKGTHVSLLCDSDIATIKQFFPTPSLDLNRILTGSLFKGLASRTLTLMVGPEASFKSSFMCLCAAEAQKQGYTPVIIDTEGAWTEDFVQRWGMDSKNIIYIYESMIENILVALGQIIDGNDQKLCIIVDSIGGLESHKLIDDAVAGDVKADQGTLARKIKRMLKMILRICKGQDSLAMGSAHMYGNPSGYGESEVVGGGKFVKLAPDTIIALKKTKMLDKDKNVIGNTIKACTLKNRLYPPFNEAIIDINYKDGINPLAGIMNLAVDAGVVTKGGAGWYTNTITGEKYQGDANASKCLTPEILTKLDEWIQNTGYSTVNKVLEEAVGIIEHVEEIEEDLETETSPSGKKLKSMSSRDK